MKVLIVAAYNKQNFSPFIMEQADSLKNDGCEIEHFGIIGKGMTGYLKNRKKLLQKIRGFQPDIIHAHYGLSGLLANLQRKVPVVTTYHGSDINNNRVFRISKLAIKLSKYNIFVSHKNLEKSKVKKKYSLIPCGIDTAVFYPQNKAYCIEKMNLDNSKRYVLFSGAFDNKVKNPELAKEAVAKAGKMQLLELKGYNRAQVACLMNAVDTCLMTSHSEGSPQFIKEALACNCPIVSLDVGDVKEMINGVENCYIADDDIEDLANKITQTFTCGKRTNGREKLLEKKISLEDVSKELLKIYRSII